MAEKPTFKRLVEALRKRRNFNQELKLKNRLRQFELAKRIAADQSREEAHSDYLPKGFDRSLLVGDPKKDSEIIENHFFGLFDNALESGNDSIFFEFEDFWRTKRFEIIIQKYLDSRNSVNTNYTSKVQSFALKYLFLKCFEFGSSPKEIFERNSFLKNMVRSILSLHFSVDNISGSFDIRTVDQKWKQKSLILPDFSDFIHFVKDYCSRFGGSLGESIFNDFFKYLILSYPTEYKKPISYNYNSIDRSGKMSQIKETVEAYVFFMGFREFINSLKSTLIGDNNNFADLFEIAGDQYSKYYPESVDSLFIKNTYVPDMSHNEKKYKLKKNQDGWDHYTAFGLSLVDFKRELESTYLFAREQYRLHKDMAGFARVSQKLSQYYTAENRSEDAGRILNYDDHQIE